MKEIMLALKQLGMWLEWEQDSIEDFHAYSQQFGFSAGSNVFKNALSDALRYRGITVEQLRKYGPHKGDA